MTNGLAINPYVGPGWDIHVDKTACSGYSAMGRSLILLYDSWLDEKEQWREDLYTEYNQGYIVVAPMLLVGWTGD